MRIRRFAAVSIVALAGTALAGLPASASASDLVLTTSQTFSSLDGSANDADATSNGVFVLDGDLILEQGGEITCNDGPPLAASASACDIHIVVANNLAMRAGSAILAENRVGNGSGGDIDVEVSGDLSIDGDSGSTPGAVISSSRTNVNGCGAAGNISLSGQNFDTDAGSRIVADSAKNGKAGDIVVNGNDVSIGGLVESAVLSGQTGTGGKVAPDGGPITIDAACSLGVGGTGKVSSTGRAVGADLVHLEGGCDVLIRGLVESTALGSAIPNSPTNHCHYRVPGTPGGTPLDDPQDPMPDKPSGSTACVEIWSGGSMLIDRTSGSNGEINADISTGCAHGRRSWIDLYSVSDIAIVNDPGADYAVHANNKMGGDTTGGIVNVKSPEGGVFTFGKAVQTDAVGGSKTDGGEITIEGNLTAELPDTSLSARGDANVAGGYGNGGKVEVRSFNGGLLWTNGVGDVSPTGASVPAANRGVATLTYCDPLDTTGTVFSSIGSATTPAVNQSCGGAPQLPSYVILS